MLGPITVTANLTRGSGRVLSVSDLEDGKWILKTVETQDEFDRELDAYTFWVPSFADQAPALRHADPCLRTLILEHLPGTIGWSFDPDDHRDAGRLLRRMHEAAPFAQEGIGVAGATADTWQRVLRRLPEPGLVSATELEFVRKSVRDLAHDFDHLPIVPCHGDYGGHNWLRGGRQLAVIDFAGARLSAAATDFARLYVGPWWERPDLAAAFFAGYGRAITTDELECVRLQLPLFALRLISVGRRHGNTEMESRGRYRLGKLIDGVDFTSRPTGWRRAYHSARALVQARSSGSDRL